MQQTLAEKLALRKAVAWWRLAYWVGYVGAAYHSAAAFVVYDGRGVPRFGFNSIYTLLALALAAFVALVSWGLHRWMSTACGLSLLLLAFATGMGCSLADESPGQTIAAWMGVYICLRGLIAVRKLNRFCRSVRSEKRATSAHNALS